MPTVPHAPASSAAQHELLIVGLDADDLREPDRTRAADLTQTCDGCAQLAADLAALRAATHALPARPRTRDFRLTPADAERLRPTAARRLLGWLAGPRSSVRPLAGSLAALGLAGLLVASVPGMLGRTASAPAALTSQGAYDLNSGAPSAAARAPEGGASFSGNNATASAAASAAASQAALGPAASPSAASAPSPAPAASAAAGGPPAAPSVAAPPSPMSPTTSSGRGSLQVTPSPIAAGSSAAGSSASACPCGKAATGSAGPSPTPGQLTASTAETPPGNSPLVPASALLLAVGAALFGARLIARRLI